MRTRAVIAAATMLLGLSGCATVEPSEGFEDVQALVSERTDYHIQWEQAGEDDAAVDEAVQQMLGDGLRVEEAVQIALLNNPALRAIYEELPIAQADLVGAGLLGNPVFDAEALFGKDELSIGLSVVQPFMDVFLIPLRTRMAESAFEATKLRVAGAVIDLAAQAQRTFYRLQAGAQRVELRQTVLLGLKSAYEFSQRLRAAGNITERDLMLSRAQYEQAKVDLAEAHAEVVVLRTELNKAMGLWGNAAEQWEVDARLAELPDEEVAPGSAQARAIASSLGLGMLRQEILAGAARLGLARPTSFIPGADIGARFEDKPGEAWVIGPTLSVALPIFNWGQATVPQAQARLRQAQQRYTALAVEVRASVRAATVRVADSRARVTYYREVVLPLRTRAVALTQLQYNAMQIGIFELLEVHREQIQAGVNYIEALEAYWLAHSALEQILNGQLPAAQAGQNVGEASR